MPITKEYFEGDFEPIAELPSGGIERMPSFLNTGLADYAKEDGGGRPTTEEGKQFIEEYFARFQEVPTPKQVASYKKGLGRTNLTYTPESTMGQLGWENELQSLAWRRGQAGAYGPNLSDSTPRGGIVITRDGVPAFRTFEPERYRGALSRGEFIQPTGGGLFDLEQLFEAGGALPQGMPEPTPGQYYRPPAQPFESPSLEEALGTFAPTEVYKARMGDYLSQQMAADEAEVSKWIDYYNNEKNMFDRRKKEGELNEVTYNQAIDSLTKLYNDKIAPLMTSDKASSIFDMLLDLTNKGYAPEDIHAQIMSGNQFTLASIGMQEDKSAIDFYNPAQGFSYSPEAPQQPQNLLRNLEDVQGITGAKVQELYNRILGEKQAAYEQANRGTPTFGEQVTTQGMGMQRGGQGTQFVRDEYEPMQRGTEERDYYIAVQQQGLAPEAEQYAMSQFSKYYFQWQQSGMKQPFMQWLNQTLSGG